jgi:hypothetical protein
LGNRWCNGDFFEGDKRHGRTRLVVVALNRTVRTLCRFPTALLWVVNNIRRSYSFHGHLHYTCRLTVSHLTSPRVCLFLYMTTQSHTALSSRLNPSRSLRNHASLSCNLFLHSCKPGSDLIQSCPITGLFHMQSLYSFCTLRFCPPVLCKPTRRPKRPKEDEHAIIMHATCSISSNPSSPARLLSLQNSASPPCKPRDGRKQDMQGNAIESIPSFFFPDRVSVILAGPERSVVGGSPVRRHTCSRLSPPICTGNLDDKMLPCLFVYEFRISVHSPDRLPLPKKRRFGVD